MRLMSGHVEFSATRLACKEHDISRLSNLRETKRLDDLTDEANS